jgi:histidine triad (HIT) family protein
VELHDPVALMTDCIFCKIGAGTLPASEVYRDAELVAIEDLNPQAPTHLLVMPIRHYTTLVDTLSPGDSLAGRLTAVAAKLGQERGGQAGFRLVINTGPQGGQTVGHVHVHVLAGRPMTWPPG